MNHTPREPCDDHNERVDGRVRGRRAAAAWALLGAAACVLLLAVALHEKTIRVVGPVPLPLVFLVAGTVATRARPDHPGLRQLQAVGALHLSAFAVSGWVGALLGDLPASLAWAGALLADAAYLGGFVALGLLLALYPTGVVRTRTQRLFARAAVAAAFLGLLVEGLLHAALDPVVEVESSRPVPAPAGLPVADVPVPGLLPVLLVVLAAVVVLGVSARDYTVPERRAVSWARLAGIVLAVLILVSPVLEPVVGGVTWAVVFMGVVSGVPVLLVAGLVRFRLLAIDLLVVRTFARAVVALVVLAAYAGGAAALGHHGFWPVAAVVTVLAALTGRTVLRRLEAFADRWVTGRRVGARVVREELADLLAREHEGAASRLCRSLEQGLEASWVTLSTTSSQARVPSAGETGPGPEVRVPLVADGHEVGVLEAGPRRGGWNGASLELLQRAADQLALVLRQQLLTSELAQHVEELRASRERLVHAEEAVRRQVERDLHDGVQQQLVALLAMIGVAAALLPEESPAAEQLGRAHDIGRDTLADLRRLVAGIHPALLEDHGLAAAVEARTGQLPLEVTLDVDPRLVGVRLAPAVEAAAFFLVCEALNNVVKHSGSQHARVVLAPLGAGVRVAVVDEGSGFVTSSGTGLRGLRDRIEAIGGRLEVQSVPGVGTTVAAEIDPQEMPALGREAALDA